MVTVSQCCPFPPNEPCPPLRTRAPEKGEHERREATTPKVRETVVREACRNGDPPSPTPAPSWLLTQHAFSCAQARMATFGISQGLVEHASQRCLNRLV